MEDDDLEGGGARRSGVPLGLRPRDPVEAAPEPEARPRPRGLQDAFLEEMRRARVRLTVFLKGGARLQGVVAGYDAHCLLLDQGDRTQLLYKHAISTDMPMEPASVAGDAPGQAREVGAPRSGPRARPPARPVRVERRGPRRPRALGPRDS